MNRLLLGFWLLMARLAGLRNVVVNEKVFQGDALGASLWRGRLIGYFYNRACNHWLAGQYNEKEA